MRTQTTIAVAALVVLFSARIMSHFPQPFDGLRAAPSAAEGQAPQPQTPPAKPPAAAPTGYKDTPKQPDGKWLVHDDDRPRPVVVTPGPFVGLPAPSDAIVLLGANTDLSKWQMTQGGGPVSWPIDAGGVM